MQNIAVMNHQRLETASNRSKNFNSTLSEVEEEKEKEEKEERVPNIDSKWGANPTSHLEHDKVRNFN